MTRPTGEVLYNLYIYTNDECNLACKHCWLTAKFAHTVTKKYVTIDMYKNFIDQAISLGLGYVKISGGEALLSREEAIALVRYTHERNVPTRIETNGTLVDEELARIFKQTGTMVSVSVDGSTADLHERMRLVPGCFQDTMRGLSLLRDQGVPVEIIFCMYRDNLDDLPNVARLASTMKSGRVKINPVVACGRGRKMESKGERLDTVELLQIAQKVERDRPLYSVPVTMSSEPAFHSLDYMMRELVTGGRCGFRSLLGILASGDVSFCGIGSKAPEYIFGNVSKIDLASVWFGHPKLLEIRGQVPDKLEGICANCVFKKSCQGACRASAYEAYGSITAPSPGCQGLYDEGLFPKRRMIDPLRECHYDSDNGESHLPV